MQTANTKLFLTLIILVGFAIGYVFYSQAGPGVDDIPAAPATGHGDVSTLKDIRLNFGVLDNPAYKALIVNGELPVSPGVTGKKDVFAP